MMVEKTNESTVGEGKSERTATIELRPDVFYLGFNKDTGELVEAIPPAGRRLKLDPAKVKRLSLGLLDEKAKQDVLERLKCVNELIKDNSLAPRSLTFVDLPNQSVCCGSCGGIPFSWC
jgi:hypothetical protein